MSSLPAGLGVGWRWEMRHAQAKLTPAFVEVLAENHNPRDLDEHLQVLVDSDGACQVVCV